MLRIIFYFCLQNKDGRKGYMNNDGFVSLSSLKTGQKAIIRSIARECKGMERRRLLDLGFVPGSEVELAITGPFSDPKAYRVKGTVIALRKEQADCIQLAS
jgi:DtxR family transcriptional regulator, Mn-dependent transcriptional regulator